MDPPIPPLESDCCNSGCNPCILDVYEAQLKKYKENCQKVGNFENSGLINAVSLTSYTKFSLTNKERLSDNVFLFRFSYCDDRKKIPNCFHYKPGQYLLLRAKDFDGEFTRAYTPIPVENQEKLGFTILVKIYNIGRMSKFFKKIQIGDKCTWRGPYGDFNISYNYKHILFIAQGTGIAPLFAVINNIIQNEECETFMKLFFCCHSCDDILLRDQLYQLSSYWNFNYEIFLNSNYNIVEKYNETIHKSKLTRDNLANYVSNKLGNLQAIICGSEAFNENIKLKIEELGIESSHIYLF